MDTNASGDITGWAVEFISAAGFFYSCNSAGIPSSIGDCGIFVEEDRASDGFGSAFNDANPGTWVTSTAPEPSAALLVVFGLVGLAVTRRRARQ